MPQNMNDTTLCHDTTYNVIESHNVIKWNQLKSYLLPILKSRSKID